MWHVISAILLGVLAFPAWAHEYHVGDIFIFHPYAHSTPPGAGHGEGYLMLVNLGEADERLLAVQTDFGEATIRRRATPEDVAVPINGLALPVGETISLTPGGTHIRFEGTAGRPFAIGDKFNVTLVFEQLGAVALEFWVESRAAQDVSTAEQPVVLDTSERPPISVIDRAAVSQALRALVGADAVISHVAVAENVALAGWYAGDKGGRAFLRETDGLWTVELFSGPSLATSAGLRAQRLSPSAARRLHAGVLDAEADLDPDIRVRIDGFVGTVFVDGGTR